MSKKVILELTPLEAGELYSVANNGWGDGDWASYLLSMGKRAELAAVRRAFDKLQKARSVVKKPKSAPPSYSQKRT